jgi:hypothetical protein
MTTDEFKARFPRWEHLAFEYGRWTTTHENYDASWEGEEDGWADNGLMCEGRTLEELADEVEAKEEDMRAEGIAHD